LFIAIWGAMSMTSDEGIDGDPSSKRDAEIDRRLEKIEQEQRHARWATWTNPIAVALVLLAIAVLAHAGVLLFGSAARESRAATERVLATIAAANTNAAPRDLANCPPANARPDLSLQWLNVRCQYRFPPNDGFNGPARDMTLQPGDLVDRYGQPGGSFLAPPDASYEARALPYDRTKMDYYKYKVLKPLTVKAGDAVPWFDQSGGGVQYKTDKAVRQLVIDGYLEEVLKVPQ
jgi:hypothetical protein